MGADFAFAQFRMGESMVARLGNAYAAFGGNAAIKVQGVFRRRTAQAPMGDYMRTTTRDVTLTVITGELPQTVADGTAVAVYAGQQLVAAVGYRVSKGGRTDDTDTGLTTFQLEAA